MSNHIHHVGTPALEDSSAKAMGKIGQRVISYDDVPDPSGPRGFVTVELREREKPVFSFPKQPASQSEPRP